MLGSGFCVISYYSDGFRCEQITTQTKEMNLNKWGNHNNNIKLAAHQSHGDDRATEQSKQAQLKQRRPGTTNSARFKCLEAENIPSYTSPMDHL